MPGHEVHLPVDVGGGGGARGLTPAFEDFDDDHATTAARAWCACLWLFGRHIIVGRWRDGEQLAHAFETDLSGAAGEQAVVADAVEALWQDMKQEPADERCGTPSISTALFGLRSSGVEVPDELLTHVAPLGWEHIGLTGDYLWNEMDKPREWFRPLRLHQNGRAA